MANLFPSIFPYAPDSPEMKKLGIQTEFDVYTELGTTYDETIDVLCEPKFIKRNYLGAMRDGEYADFIILHPKKGILFFNSSKFIINLFYYSFLLLSKYLSKNFHQKY